MLKTLRTSSGFTVVEMLIVIVVIGILATLSIVSYNGVRTSAKESFIKSEASSIYKQLAFYNIRNGTYPSDTSSIKYDDSVGIQYTYDSETNSYCLTASNSAGDFYITELNKNTTSGVCTGDTPGAPTGLAVTATGNLSVGLSWNSVTGATSYDAQCDSASDYSSSPQTSNTGTTSATVSGLTAGTVYCHVRANGSESSSYSDNISDRVTITSGLIGHWKLNGNANDSSSSGYDGTINGSPTSVTGQNGQNNGAYDFNGNSYIDIGDVYNSITVPITLSGWVYRQAGTDAILFISSEDGDFSSNSGGFKLRVTSGTYYCEASIYNGGTVSRRRACGGNGIDAGSWSHVVGIINGGSSSGDIVLYVNGSSAGSNGDVLSSDTISTGSRHAIIGASLISTDKYTTDILDDIRIYNRALSTAEISELYNAGAD